jgi:putative tricarboxylic transport membrane protein
MKFNDAIIGCALIVLAGLILWSASSFPPMPGQDFGPALFPSLIAVGLAACGLALMREGARQWRTQLAVELSEWVRTPRLALNFALIVAGMTAYIVFAERLGFLVVMPVVLSVWLIALGSRWRVAATVALAVSLLIHYIFYTVLKVPLPWGLLTDYAW